MNNALNILIDTNPDTVYSHSSTWRVKMILRSSLAKVAKSHLNITVFPTLIFILIGLLVILGISLTNQFIPRLYDFLLCILLLILPSFVFNLSLSYWIQLIGTASYLGSLAGAVLYASRKTRAN